MSQLHEVDRPIINSPYEEPTQYYEIVPGEPPVLKQGRRPAFYYYRPPARKPGQDPTGDPGRREELALVNELRRRVKEWREKDYPGVTRTTLDLLNYWQKPDRELDRRLFFCQREAAETVIFLVEARADLRQGLEIPRDEPGDDGKAKGYTGFVRYACKMATGSGKTTVMAMLAAWSILNKINSRNDGRFSDVVLVLCPNVTIRERLGELDPNLGEKSIYRTRDLVPPGLMEQLRKGFVVVTNWHVLEPRAGNQVNGESARVVDKGPESDTALVQRVMGRHVGGKQNILVMNDEAHHAYRLGKGANGEDEEMEEEEAGEDDEERKEATVWIGGLDKIHKVRGINLCVDLSATPYYLNNTGNDPGRPFPWVVSDFGLIDAIESGLVKIPQLPVQDSTGEIIPAYFNVWKWILEEKLTSAERGGRRGQISSKAVLKYAQVPIAQLAGLWRETFREWQKDPMIHPTPPVFIIVCRDTTLAKAVYNWIANGEGETDKLIEEFLNRDGKRYTERVDSKVAAEISSGTTKSNETKRLRFVLETVGRTTWPGNKPPDEWVKLAEELGVDPFIPPGRDVRCIISVAMLTEGWDARTVTHIVGLRPFESQLLCEQVVGRGLRRSQYQDLTIEEEAKVYGVPFEIIPFKAPPRGPVSPPPKTHHVYAMPERAHLEIIFPRVESYAYAIRSRITVDWECVPRLIMDPLDVPPDVLVKALTWTVADRPTLLGPGKTDKVGLDAWRKGHRRQELEYDLARTLTKRYAGTPTCEVPPHRLFPQMLRLVSRFLAEKLEARGGYDLLDAFLNPYYGWIIETLTQSIRPDAESGEAPEMPVYETQRGPGSTRDVDYYTSRDIRDVTRSHLNAVALDTKTWEQSAAFYLEIDDSVISFAKNAGLGFAIPYLHNGQYHEYIPDFLVRLQAEGSEIGTLILETKGYDKLAEVKQAAALRWVAAVNTDGRYGRWAYRMIREPGETAEALRSSIVELTARGRMEFGVDDDRAAIPP
ncbi:MAG: BPTD_3080 family restriction endonuclease [Patescibacteria group bacterium]